MGEQTGAPARPLYDRLKQIQLENGWTNVQLAQKAGIKRGTIDNWARQPRSPRPDTVKSVAENLNIDYLEALALAGITSAPSGQETARAPEEDLDGQAERVAAKLPPEVREAIEGGEVRETSVVTFPSGDGSAITLMIWHGPKPEGEELEQLRREEDERFLRNRGRIAEAMKRQGVDADVIQQWLAENPDQQGDA
jgi:transcriptional regulator with XRE-family HTH domain